MADKTKIEWTDATWNPITGCSIVSPGCTNCYAMKLAGSRLKHIVSRKGLTRDSKVGPVWTGEVRFNEEWLDQPLRWKAPRMIFVCAHGDLFAENVPDEWIDKIFAVMALSPQHTFQVLTKRPERMREYLTGAVRDIDIQLAAFPMHQKQFLAGQNEFGSISYKDGAWFLSLPLPNVWLGVSVEDQKRADERLPVLLDTPAALLWVSNEPALGPIDWKRWLPTGRRAIRPGGEPFIASQYFMTKCEYCGWIGSSELCHVDSGDDCDVVCPDCERSFLCDEIPAIGWMITGGESGHGARPMQAAWARAARDQCEISNTPFHFKQWGVYAPTSDCNGPYMMHVGKRAAGRLLDGVTHDAFPQVRT